MKRIAEAVLPLLTGVLGFVASPFLLGFWGYAADVALPKLSKQQHLSLLATLTIICLLLAVLVYRNASKSVMLGKYQHSTKEGFWKHRKTGERVCGNCLLLGIQSPLSAYSYSNGQKNLWECGVKTCEKQYPLSDEDMKKLTSDEIGNKRSV